MSTDSLQHDLEEILDILACPVTRSRLQLKDNMMTATVGGRCYPIKDGIVRLFPEDDGAETARSG